MALRKSFSLVLVFIISVSSVFAQKMDVGVSSGLTYYYGDVVNEITPQSLRYSLGGFARFYLGDNFDIRTNLLYANVSGNDKYSSSPWQKERNWEFSTNILEGSVVLEYNLIPDRNSGRRIRNPFIPYLYGGVGMFYFNPSTDVNGVLYSVRELELSGVKYDYFAVCYPMGFGFRYYAYKNYMVGLDLGIRYTNTSYIDDIGGNDKYVDPSTTPRPDLTEIIYSRTSENKNPGDYRGKMGLATFPVRNINDLYFIGSVTFAYRLGKNLGSKGRGFGGKAISCPRFY